MKYFTFFLVLGLTISEVNSQYLLAGFGIDSSCIKNLDPDIILSPTPNSPNLYLKYDIDINQNAIPDFCIEVTYAMGSHGMSENREVRILPLHMNKIAFSRIDTSDHEPSQEDILLYVAQKFSMGDTINDYSKFINETVYLANNTWVLGQYLITIDDWLGNAGFIGVYLNETAKYYWIKVQVNNTSSITIMELLNDCNMTRLQSLFGSDKTIGLFPNPSNGYIFINNKYNISTLNIFNSDGLLVKKFFNLPSNELIKIDLSDLDMGVYIIQMCDKYLNNQYTKKLIIN